MRSLLLLCCFCTACCQAQSRYATRPALNPAGYTIAQRFPAPEGYFREAFVPGSFAAYLRQLPLQSAGSAVHHYDGSLKRNTAAYCAVVRMDIGNRDLQQCADAVMRLRGEYLFTQKQWDQLGFLFSGDRKMHYFRQESADLSYAAFRKWMDKVFAYANTRSLHQQLKAKRLTDVQPGDVLVQTGNPYGHAVIVMDVLVHKHSGNKLFLLAQSYMPAQEIQVLNNPANPASPWYSLQDTGPEIRTPEWVFTTSDLRSF